MNILVPDSWLREYLKTEATPKKIAEYVSLSGPSFERINTVDGETVYDIEITGNRPDAMSVAGIAREAAAILPRYGVSASFTSDPYAVDTSWLHGLNGTKTLSVTTDSTLNPRFTAVVLTGVRMTQSPEWMQKRLTLTGLRPINAVVDVTNYLMRAFGQPMHAFDYAKILPKDGVATMKLRASIAGETIMTLDGKTHTLPGGDIVIEDGSGRLIDLAGIMGGGVSHIGSDTDSVLLFVQTYDPVRIRRTSMALAHRTDAASLFEKGTDPELVLPTMAEGIRLLTEIAGAKTDSTLTDIYPAPYEPVDISVDKGRIDTYIGVALKKKDITDSLAPLGLSPTFDDDLLTVTVPSWRRDVGLDVDVIEEIARMYGYHAIPSRLPDTQMPVAFEAPALTWETMLKGKLADWGYTETYTFSMLSDRQLSVFGIDPATCYRIANPLSSEWVYMRPSLLPSVLTTVADNLSHTDRMEMFEMSMVYDARPSDLPRERQMLAVTMTGEAFAKLKGLSETIFAIFGIAYPEDTRGAKGTDSFHPARSLALGDYGTVGEIHPAILRKLGISAKVTVLELDMEALVRDAKPAKSYVPVPKYPAIREDLSFTVGPTMRIGPFLSAIASADPLIAGVDLIDQYRDARLVRVTYRAADRTLTSEDIAPVRERIVTMAAKRFGAERKTA